MTVKLLYLWFGPARETSLSQREIARALGVSQGAVSLSLARWRALGLEDDKKVDTRESIESVPLPAILLAENPTTKLVYLYLSPHSKVEVSVRQLERLLYTSHRSTAEAIQRLVALKLLKVLEQSKNRSSQYEVSLKNQKLSQTAKG